MQAYIHKSHRDIHPYTHTCVISGLQPHINPPSHPYTHIRINEQQCKQLHAYTTSDKRGDTHPFTHTCIRKTPTCIHWLIGTNIRHANMRTCRHAYTQSHAHAGNQAYIAEGNRTYTHAYRNTHIQSDIQSYIQTQPNRHTPHIHTTIHTMHAHIHIHTHWHMHT